AYFNGSHDDNIARRQGAIERGLRLNKDRFYRSQEETRDPKWLTPCRTEQEIFQALYLAYVPPELREGQGEFEAAETGSIPRLLEWVELRGSLTNHSTWSDGWYILE